MEKDNNVQLIREVLSGDDNAFSTLVQKYQKSMHALAWRKIGDFHYAEEIVQDAFLEAYKGLETLEDHKQFAGWLYVITSRCCVNWLRKNTSKTQSLESTSGQEIAELSYEHYLSEQRDAETVERNEAIVKFEAQSERTIEIIDAPITLDIDSKPSVRNQIGQTTTPSQNSGAGLQTSLTSLASDSQKASLRRSTSQWTQASGPQGSPVFDIFATSKGTVYAATPASIYRLTPDATAWTPIDIDTPVRGFGMPMTEYRGFLYIVYPDRVLTSIDNGETWHVLCSRPTGYAVELIITAETERNSSRDTLSMYLALRDKGIFRSTDGGKQWKHLDNGLKNKRIYAVAAVENTVFAGTNEGLFHFNSDVWEQLPVDTPNAVHSLAVMKNNLYVATGPDSFVFGLPNVEEKHNIQIVTRNTARPWKIFRTTDLGRSWTEITPKNKSTVMMTPRSVKILAAGKTLLVLDGIRGFRSNDGGQTWTDLGLDSNSVKQNIFPAVAVEEKLFTEPENSEFIEQPMLVTYGTPL